MDAVGTLRQWEKRYRAQCCAENHITGAHYDRHYPPGSRTGQWANALQAFVRDGGTLTRYELDAMDREGYNVHMIFRGTWSHGIPAGYLTPDVRARHADK